MRLHTPVYGVESYMSRIHLSPLKNTVSTNKSWQAAAVNGSCGCVKLWAYLAVLSGALYYSCHSAKLPMKHQFAAAKHLLFRQDGLLYSPNPVRPVISGREMLKQQQRIAFPFDQMLCGSKSFCRPLSEVLSALKGRHQNPIENQTQLPPNMSRLTECCPDDPKVPQCCSASMWRWFASELCWSVDVSNFYQRLFHRANQPMSSLADLRSDRECWLLQEVGPPEGTNWLWIVMATSHGTSGR